MNARISAFGRAVGRSPYAGVALVAAGSIILIGVVIAIAGFDPVAAVVSLVSQSLGTTNGVTEVVVRSIPLTLTGLGIAVAFRARMFNVGADGQIIFGAIAFVGFSLLFPTLTGWLLLPLAMIAGVLGGALWGGIAGVLRARYNASEIIVTIMLTYVAFQVLGWAIRGPLQESMKVFPRSDAVPESVTLGLLIEGSRLHWGLLIALAATAAVYLALRFGSFGYRLDAVGENPAAARHGGIGDRATMALSLVVSGGLAGLAGAVEIAGIHGRLQDAFAEGTGITAIAVALLARLNPLFVPLAALLFAILAVGAGGLQRQLGIPFPLVHIVEGIVILAFLIATRLRPAAAKA
jgi:simple sugar transport system permease protein